MMLKPQGSYSWIKITVVLLFLAGGTWLYFNQLTPKEVQFVTQEEVQIDTLTDGSIVTLNKRSLLRYPDEFEGEERHVWLTKGEGFFSVRSADKPFYITVASTLIKLDSGTLNVRKLGGRVEVISETGTLELSRNGKMLKMGPGEISVLKQNKSDLTKEENADRLYTYYRNNEFITNGTPLSKMVKALNESFGSNVMVRRRKLNNVKLTGTYKSTSLDSILQEIAKKHRIRIEKRQNRIFLY